MCDTLKNYVILLPITYCLPNHRGQRWAWQRRRQIYLQTASFYRVEHEQFLQQIFTVGRHVERNAVFSTQDPLPQLLEQQEGDRHMKHEAILIPSASADRAPSPPQGKPALLLWMSSTNWWQLARISKVFWKRFWQELNVKVIWIYSIQWCSIHPFTIHNPI